MAPMFANNIEPEIVSFCVNLLCKSIQRFYQKDAQFLFGSRIVDERALVGCVYRYMWCALEPLGRIFDIDIEYDRITDDEVGSDEESRHVNRVKRIESSAANRCCQKKCEKLNECADCLITKMNEKIVGKDYLGLRPDIIVHRRGKSGRANNAMWIEFKKTGGDYSDALFDQAKVMFNSCNKHEGLLYRIGAMVMLREKYAHVGFFSNGQILYGYVVDATEPCPMTKEEERQNLWCRPKLDK
ncbi:MAG: hypothetical protein IJQ73_15670 [Kiritimatiellae bacterium]|nr:hypothetical protein [Kiritimatiellia bacterium]